jgi:ubiquitin-like 1-activating enzyme E1 B
MQIDLDTIEVSNLNRQFLFRKHHVGHSKASVAAAAVKQFRPDVTIVAHQANVKESKYDIDFFQQFDLVLNGLDNLDARRHVNRMCLAAKVPLVESGTAGYLGQVSVHVGGQTECFDCQPKPVAKSYAVCTIRTSPDKPIHCVVWAKELLFPLLFGPSDGENDLDPSGALIRGSEESATDYAKKVFNHVFDAKIREVLETAEKDVWEGRALPQPILLESLKLKKENGSTAAVNGGTDFKNVSTDGNSACVALGLTNQNEVWTAEQSAAVFIEATRQILVNRSSDVGSLCFDKDDDLAVEFVSAAANLRSMCYHIPPQSLFDTKGMAGNIIHAIATTNAIISGLIVVEAMKLLAGKGDATTCRASFLRQDLSNRKFIIPTMLEPPNPGCAVCGTARLQVRVNTNKTTLEEFLKKVLRGHLGMTEPCFTYPISNSEASIIYEEGEGLEADEIEENVANLPKLLAELPAGGVVHNTVLYIQDQRQHLKLEMVVSHQEEWDEKVHPSKFVVEGDVPVAAAETEEEDGVENAAATTAEGAVGRKGGPLSLENADGTFNIVDSEDEGPAIKAAQGKRKHAATEDGGDGGEGDGGEAKRAKVAAADDEDFIILD